MQAQPSLNGPAYARGDDEAFTATNLSRRPRDWRADYSPKRGVSSYLPKIGRVRSDVEEYSDPVKRTIHPLLQFVPDSPPLAFDLRFKVVDGNAFLFQHLGRNYNEVDLAQLAVNPVAPMLRLYHSRLPWYIDVHQSHTTGVTVFDVLVQLSLQMQTPIHNRHYYNDTLDAADKIALGVRYKERTKGRVEEGRRGILQVDFLGEKFVLEGLVRGKQGMWEVKTRRLN
ncbi:hypothetical protein P691DRAFT_664674 [Macrolepiota fuliginosa MF-IS2]|uniref:DUF6699 domain-containing protein n=1 Tax=Macrolepiota fuliginosa MF-IS2 TaxID=1400762 RepID=A0A9P5XG35_9AGAR|nr:hypothetical protein P691DRAFT_664674 [Macrolepiota fuliginosa MF-IS2]